MYLRELTSVLDAQLIESDTTTTTAGDQRRRNHEYYAMQPMGNEMRGRSQYVDPSVMDVVESKKAYFREIFFSGKKCLKFLPGENEAQWQADAKTAYVERQLKRNEWFRVFRDALHNALVAKRAVIHAEWLEDEDVTLLDIVQGTPQQLQWQLQAIPDVVDADLSAVQQNPDGTLTGTVRAIVDSSCVKLRVIAPENYHRDPEADYVENCAFIAFSDYVTRGQLIADGFDPDQVMNLSAARDWRDSEEDASRRSHDLGDTRLRSLDRVKEAELIRCRWSYSWLNLSEYLDDAPDDIRLYRIRWVDSEVLTYADGGHFAIDEVSEMPFFEWEQYKIPHTSGGMCDADVLAPLQKQLSTFKRLIMDNQQMANTSRWKVLTGGVRDIRSLTDTAIGGVVEELRPGAIDVLPPPPLSPATLPAIELLETDKESRTGNTRLAKGMNKDAVSQQNASDMIDRITNSANRRVAGEARDFAESLLAPLMQYIYCLGVRHDYRTYLLEVAGAKRNATPQEWAEPAPTMEVAVALTPEEGAKQAMSLMQMHQMLSMDPAMSQLYGLNQRHALFDQMFDFLGVDDASRFMMTPGGEEHQQSMQAAQQQQQQQMMQAMQLQQFQQRLMMSGDQREWLKVNLDRSKTIADVSNIASDNLREDEKLDHQKIYDFAKLRAGKNG